MNQVAKILTERYQLKQFCLQPEHGSSTFAEHLWERIVNEKRLDRGVYDPASGQVNIDKLCYKNVHEIGQQAFD